MNPNQFNNHKHIIFGEGLRQSQQSGYPMVALESTVITHGLPFPDNLKLANDLETIVRGEGATPATIGVIEGDLVVGMSSEQLKYLATHPCVQKISSRDIASAIVQKISGGTTVAATLVAACIAEIKVFSTGGIGGVHRKSHFDVSADLPQMSKSPVVLVCAGAKSILDIEATLEYLETLSIPVIGYQTEDFPAFITRKSGFKTSASVQSASEVAEIALTHWQLGFQSAVIVSVPIPSEDEYQSEQLEKIIIHAEIEMEKDGIRGKKATPYLLKRVAELSGGESVKSNLSLLKNNAKVAALIAKEISRIEG